MRHFVRGDVDGFFGLALDNLVQLLLIDALCRFVLGFSADLLYGTILPGVAISLVIGNLYYARQALKLSESTGRTDHCALPYGINTVSLFAHVFLVMLPAKLAAEAAGAADPEGIAWRAGLIACIGSGLIETGGAFVADKIRSLTPRAALLSTLSGIALGFISLGFLFRSYAHPLIGLSTLAITLITYFGAVRFRGGIPGGAIAVGVGTVIALAQGLSPTGQLPQQVFSLEIPIPQLGALAQAFSEGSLGLYLSVVLPMGIFNVLGSLQNIESAEAAGDPYPTKPSLLVNGIGTLGAALFGSCFPTTIYIGHPGWKAMGARAGYSTLNAIFIVLIALSGSLALIAWAIPIDAGLAIVIWIGIVITAQAFTSTPKSHAPAVVLGILPGVAAWGALMAKNGLRAAGTGVPGGAPFGPGLIDAFKTSDTWIHGAFALEQGFILTAMVLAAATVELVERRFQRAAMWFALGSLASMTGLMHSYQFTFGDSVATLTPAYEWAAGYAVAAIFAWITPYVSTEGVAHTD